MESTGTVKAFFIFFGSLGILGHLAEAMGGQKGLLLPIVGLCLAISYVCVGLFLSALLARLAWLVRSLLIAGFLYTLVSDIARISSGESPLFNVAGNLLFALFLTWYLLGNVKKLSTESQNGTGEGGGATHNPARMDA